MANDYFQQSYALDVHFYDPTASSELLFNLKPGTLEKFNLTHFDDLFQRDDADEYLEYEAGDGGYEGVVFDDDGIWEDDDGGNGDANTDGIKNLDF
ncbi:hypothetical protein [Achromobacter insolitus]|uniref:hypothetical protein n=1 Tax=Achromobacter insolitus TaxID=217204 RepID=UPI0007C40189|nr:hypothetical protein [Achromobacter insolitus]OAD17878.1 hypothetical protein A3839_03350 [Achromobacter insolitus]